MELEACMHLPGKHVPQLGEVLHVRQRRVNAYSVQGKTVCGCLMYDTHGDNCTCVVMVLVLFVVFFFFFFFFFFFDKCVPQQNGRYGITGRVSSRPS